MEQGCAPLRNVISGSENSMNVLYSSVRDEVPRMSMSLLFLCSILCSERALRLPFSGFSRKTSHDHLRPSLSFMLMERPAAPSNQCYALSGPAPSYLPIISVPEYHTLKLNPQSVYHDIISSASSMPMPSSLHFLRTRSLDPNSTMSVITMITMKKQL